LDTLKKDERNWKNEKLLNLAEDNYIKNGITKPKNKDLIERMKFKILK